MLDASADERSRRTKQRNSLALHVGTHERAVSVVVLEERNERGCNRGHLTRGNVHVLDLLRRDLVRLAESSGVRILRAAQNAGGRNELAVLVAMTENAGLEIKLVVRLGDRVVLFLVCSKEIDFVGHLAVNNATVRCLDETIGVHASIRSKRADQADVRTFRGLNRAHATVVGRVDVADFEACALTRETTRAKS